MVIEKRHAGWALLVEGTCVEDLISKDDSIQELYKSVERQQERQKLDSEMDLLLRNYFRP